jgi:electron transfer flavoprotein beta subunit
MLATLLDWACVTEVKELEIGDGKGTAKRESEAGLETIEFSLPAVVTCNKDLNEPRYAGLKGIMAAKKKPIEEVAVADLGVETSPAAVELLAVEPPPAKTGARMIDGEADAQVAELVRVLHEEEKLI